MRDWLSNFIEPANIFSYGAVFYSSKTTICLLLNKICGNLLWLCHAICFSYPAKIIKSNASTGFKCGVSLDFRINTLIAFSLILITYRQSINDRLTNQVNYIWDDISKVNINKNYTPLSSITAQKFTFPMYCFFYVTGYFES